MDQYVTHDILKKELTRTESKLRAEFRMDLDERFEAFEVRILKKIDEKLDEKIETKVEEIVGRYTGIVMEHFQSLLKGVVEVNTDHGRNIRRADERLNDHEPRIKRLEVITS